MLSKDKKEKFIELRAKGYSFDRIVNEIDNEINTTNNNETKKYFNYLELPDLLCSIIDYLQPLLLPYEASIYWYMFRHSILENGDIYIRVSTRGLGKENEVITSSSGQSKSLSYGGVQTALLGLEEKGIIKKTGDTNREGTLYQIFLPDEIKICQDLIKEKQTVELPLIDAKKEVDFYNIKENRLKIFERDNYKCTYCGKQLTRFNATLDHILPVSKGGDNSFGNLTTACLHCNSQRNNQDVMEAIIKGNNKV